MAQAYGTKRQLKVMQGRSKFMQHKKDKNAVNFVKP